jgi:hypothetical protein
MATFPRTIYFPGDDRRVIVNVMPGGMYSAIDPDQPQDGQSIIWGYGNSVLAAIADLAESLAEVK